MACGHDDGGAANDAAQPPVDANLPAFGIQQTFATGMNPTGLALGDLDGDTLVDAIVSNRYDSTICLLRGNGDGTFDACATYAAGYAPGDIAAADVNGDGKLDVLVAETGFGANVGSLVSVYLNPGDGTFEFRTSYSTGPGPLSVVAGDLDGDGPLDLAVANYGALGDTGGDGTTVSVLRNNGNGTFAAKADYPSGGTAPRVVIGDVNGDSKADLVTTNNVTGNVGVLVQTTNTMFGAPVSYAVGNRPSRPAVGDLDGDGKLDIVAGNFGVADGTTVSVLRNMGDGTFAPQQTYTVGTSPGPVVIADLNDDSRLDIVTGNVNARSVSILLNDGAGAFVSGGTLTVGMYPTSLVAEDVNRDGKRDLVVANLGESTISVLLHQ